MRHNHQDWLGYDPVQEPYARSLHITEGHVDPQTLRKAAKDFVHHTINRKYAQCMCYGHEAQIHEENEIWTEFLESYQDDKNWTWGRFYEHVQGHANQATYYDEEKENDHVRRPNLYSR